jgi:hypothetical protein
MLFTNLISARKLQMTKAGTVQQIEDHLTASSIPVVSQAIFCCDARLRASRNGSAPIAWSETLGEL